MPHDFQNHSTKYGPMYYCKTCQIMPSEYKALSDEERKEQDDLCTWLKGGKKNGRVRT